MRRGEIYMVNFDPAKGSEIKKIRPAIIVSNDLCNKYSETITVVPLSSKIDKVYPFELLLKKGEGGLPLDSKAKANQIKTIDKSRVVKLLGILPVEVIEKVETAIKIHLAIR